MDIVYILKSDPTGQYLDLRFSLRSLKNIDHENVWIVGAIPPWIQNAKHFYISDNLVNGQHNAIVKLFHIANNKEISDDFIFMNDDFIFLKEMKELPYYSFGNFSNYIHRLNKSKYKDTALVTSEMIPDSKNYSVHTPIIFNKNRIKQLHKRYGISQGLHFRTLYCDYFNVDSVELKEDVKPRSIEDFFRIVKYSPLVSLSNFLTVDKRVKKYLIERLSISKYEKHDL